MELPKELMPKQYEHQQEERKVQNQWAKEKTYRVDRSSSGPLYSIDTPPPTVSGKLHIGHVFSYTQTDIIARYKRMQGHTVFYPFGFDNNGLPTERYVEKNKNIKAQDMGRSAFIAICLQEVEAVQDVFKTLWQTLGISADWDQTYSTIADNVRALSQESFIRLYQKGHVYRTKELALFCTVCQTSVAQAELEDKELPSFFNTIIFKDHAGNDLYIATTRPELLPACVALLYNPEDDRYKHLQGTFARVPLFDHLVPVLADERVLIEKGTGLVMVCTYGDTLDVEWCKKFNLSYIQVIGLDGRMTAKAGFLQGLFVKQARIKVVEELVKASLLTAQKEIVHPVNVHERCKAPIELVLLPQWFVHIVKHKETLLALGDQINWNPSFMKARYRDWVENLSWDWGISRQRFFGIPFPVWHCLDCGHMIMASLDVLPIDPQEIPYDGVCPQCEKSNIAADTDAMDTWNTSSLTPYICRELYAKSVQSDENAFDPSNGMHAFFPMSMRPQAHDIIRTWAFDTIVKSWMHHDTVPWRDIVISGHVLSDLSKKLSKSQEGKAVTPERLLADFPADAIRYWTASAKLGMDVVFTENQIKIGCRLITKLWNAFRFMEPHIQLHDHKQIPSELGTVNEWLLHNASIAFDRYTQCLERYEFGLALEPIEQFFWNDFCDNYIELVKNQLFNPDQYPADLVHATRWTLYQVGLRVLQWFAPYLPHITETIYQLLYRKHCASSSLHTIDFKSVQTAFDFAKSAEEAQKVVELSIFMRKLKTEHKISLKTPIATLSLYGDDAIIEILKKHEQIIRGVTQAELVEYHVASLEESELQEKNGLWYAKMSAL